jgi:hypothetical protein
MDYIENNFGIVPLRRKLVVFKGFLDRTLSHLLRLYSSDKIIFVQGIQDEFQQLNKPTNNDKGKKKKQQNTKKNSSVVTSNGKKRRSEVTWDDVEEVTGPRKRIERLDVLNKTVATWWRKDGVQVQKEPQFTKEERSQKKIEKELKKRKGNGLICYFNKIGSRLCTLIDLYLITKQKQSQKIWTTGIVVI